MDAIWPILGITIILGTMVDFVWTTLTASGAGPITRTISRRLWQMALRLARRSNSSAFLTLVGPAILLATVCGWTLLLWLGWTLVFLADPMSVVNSQTGQPADFWARVYFTGFTLSTLGVGDYRPGDGLSQIATVGAAINGLVQVTLSITYLLSVLSSVVQQRSLAAQITSLGESAEGIAICGWNDQGFDQLTQRLSTFAPELVTYSQRQLAYPVITYFFSSDWRTANGPAIAMLDDLLLLLARVVPEKRPPALLLRTLRRAIHLILDSLYLAKPGSESRQPPLPDVGPLRQAGIPVIDDLDEGGVGESRDRRRQILELVEAQGWTWSDVTGAGRERRRWRRIE